MPLPPAYSGPLPVANPPTPAPPPGPPPAPPTRAVVGGSNVNDPYGVAQATGQAAPTYGLPGGGTVQQGQPPAVPMAAAPQQPFNMDQKFMETEAPQFQSQFTDPLAGITSMLTQTGLDARYTDPTNTLAAGQQVQQFLGQQPPPSAAAGFQGDVRNYLAGQQQPQASNVAPFDTAVSQFMGTGAPDRTQAFVGNVNTFLQQAALGDYASPFQGQVGQFMGNRPQGSQAAGFVGAVDQFLQGSEAPSQAEAAMQRSSNENMADALSIARGVRGGPAAQQRALRVAMANNAATGVETARDVGQLRAAETAQRQQELLQALGLAGQGAQMQIGETAQRQQELLQGLGLAGQGAQLGLQQDVAGQQNLLAGLGMQGDLTKMQMGQDAQRAQEQLAGLGLQAQGTQMRIGEEGQRQQQILQALGLAGQGAQIQAAETAARQGEILQALGLAGNLGMSADQQNLQALATGGQLLQGAGGLAQGARGTDAGVYDTQARLNAMTPQQYNQLLGQIIAGEYGLQSAEISKPPEQGGLLDGIANPRRWFS